MEKECDKKLESDKIEFQINDDTPETDKERATRIFSYLGLYAIFTIFAAISFIIFKNIGVDTKNIFLICVLGYTGMTMFAWVILTVLIIGCGVFAGDIPFIILYILVYAPKAILLAIQKGIQNKKDRKNNEL